LSFLLNGLGADCHINSTMLCWSCWPGDGVLFFPLFHARRGTSFPDPPSLQIPPFQPDHWAQEFLLRRSRWYPLASRGAQPFIIAGGADCPFGFRLFLLVPFPSLATHLSWYDFPCFRESVFSGPDSRFLRLRRRGLTLFPSRCWRRCTNSVVNSAEGLKFSPCPSQK